MRVPFSVLIVLITIFAVERVHAQTLEEVLTVAPLIVPEEDGVLYLNAEAAALVKWIEKQPVLVNDGGGMLKVEAGRIVRWGSADERPSWRVKTPAWGGYRVFVTCSVEAGRGGMASLLFQSKRKGILSRNLETTGADHALQAFEFGEMELDAGETVIEFRSSIGAVPFEFCRLADVRLVPLEKLRASARLANDAMHKLQIDTRPEIKALIETRDRMKAELDRANTELRRKDFGSFKEYRQFLEYDAIIAKAPTLDRKYKTLLRKISDLQFEALKKEPNALKPLKAEERAAIEAHIAATEELTAAAVRLYKNRSFPAIQKWQVALRPTLFETGRFESLLYQKINEGVPVVELKVQPPPDLDIRRKAFLNRNSNEGLAELCESFRAVLIPGTKGLEAFETLCAAGRHREALEAYRAYFFKKLKSPETYGAATQNILFELTRDRGRHELLLRPKDFVVEQNMKDTAVVQIGDEVLACQVGAPGSVSWVPHGVSVPESALKDGRSKQDPFWQSPQGKQTQQTLEFFRFINCLPGDRAEYYSGGIFPALLWSYAIKGEKAHLRRWCDYMDDWSANSLRDQDDFVYGMRMATDLEPQFPRCMLNLLRIILDERSQLAEDFDAATLARLMMKLVSDYTPYVIRARRAEMANWGIMSLAHQLHLARFLSEYKAMQYFNRETWRLWSANMIQHQTLDGENFEAWDEGHNFVNIGFALDGIPFGTPAEGIDCHFMKELWDGVLVDMRSKLVHISPLGNYWPEWLIRTPASGDTLRSKAFRPDAENRYYLDLMDGEAGARARISTMLSGGSNSVFGKPDRRSDLSPYAGMSYLREDWTPDADYFILQNFRERSQNQADCSRTMYSLSRKDQLLVEAHGLVVDRKPDNRYFGKIRTGGKTEYCGEAGRHVADARFHTSANFDFSEARQDSPYAAHRMPYSDVWGLYKNKIPADDPDEIKDVQVLRQVFGLRGDDVWIVCDRIESPVETEREFTQFFAIPVRLPAAGFADRLRVLAETQKAPIEVHTERRLIRTENAGFENVSIHLFPPSALTFANGLNARNEHETLKLNPVETLQAALKKRGALEQLTRKPQPFPVSARWKGAGKQVFVAALRSRAGSGEEDDLAKAEDLNGADGVLGCRLLTRSGTETWFQSGPQNENRLNCGPVQAIAETLMVVRKADGSVRGMVLGCKELTCTERVSVNASDFEFELVGGKFRVVESVHRPIDTVRISPAQNVFVNRVEVSFAIPTQKTDEVEYRYTLDGSDPTLESALFSKPFTLEETTMVKVRPFRKGLKHTPWTFSGTDSGKTVSAVFRKRALKPAIPTSKDVLPRGVRFEYFEGAWPTLFSYAGFDGVLKPLASGIAPALLDEKHLSELRKTDRAYAVRYTSTLNVPESGVYSIHAPIHLYASTMDAGYDLRVFIDDEEWFPAPTLHCENVWCVPLEKGAHRLRVAFTDYRWKKFRNDYWMAWQEEQMWRGIPVIEIEGPGLKKQPIPNAWIMK